MNIPDEKAPHATASDAPHAHAAAVATLDRFTLTADDGFKLACVRRLPSGEPRAVVQVAHGMAEYAARYAPFAEACAAAGLAFYAHDHRGHGGSVDASTPLGHFADEGGWEKVIADVHAMNRHVRQKHPKAPIFLFAHSMGSLIGRGYLLEHADTLAGAILSATGWRAGLLNRFLARVAERDARHRGARVPSKRMTKLVFGAFNLRFRSEGETGFEWLSRRKGTVDAYVSDPLCGFDCSGTLWSGIFRGLIDVERAEKDGRRLAVGLPILLIAGTHDPVSVGGFGHGQIKASYTRAGNPDVTDKRYPEGRHELVNETNRDVVFRDVIEWIDRHITATSAR